MAGKQHVTNNATTLIVSACSFRSRPAKSCHWRCSTKPTVCKGHTHTQLHRKTQTACGDATLLLAWGGFISFWKKVARNYNIVGCAVVCVCGCVCVCACVCESWPQAEARAVTAPAAAESSIFANSLGAHRQTNTDIHCTHTHTYTLTFTHCYTRTHFIRFV